MAASHVGDVDQQVRRFRPATRPRAGLVAPVVSGYRRGREAHGFDTAIQQYPKFICFPWLSHDGKVDTPTMMKGTATMIDLRRRLGLAGAEWYIVRRQLSCGCHIARLGNWRLERCALRIRIDVRTEAQAPPQTASCSA